jgi:hyperosmotically inducible periplasmic protein
MQSRGIVWVAAVAFAVVSAACGQTDAGITTAVKSKLAADNDVKAYQVDVDTNNKVVTLSGNVDTATAKTRAVEIARGTGGVANVVDNIKVTAPSVPDAKRVMYTDPALTASVKAKLIVDDLVKARNIDVDTRDGVVTLTGEVRSQAEKDQALKIARETEGVKSVTDRITVTP